LFDPACWRMLPPFPACSMADRNSLSCRSKKVYWTGVHSAPDARYKVEEEMGCRHLLVEWDGWYLFGITLDQSGFFLSDPRQPSIQMSIDPSNRDQCVAGEPVLRSGGRNVATILCTRVLFDIEERKSTMFHDLAIFI